MQDLDIEQIVQAWVEEKKDLFASPEFTAVQRVVFQSLAHGTPVSIQQVEEATQLSQDVIISLFEKMKADGADFDDNNNLTGWAITLESTAHHFNINGHNIYAWCALDTFFLPGLIDDPANIESECLKTKQKIHLTISPKGVLAVDPPEAVLSVVAPGFSTACEPGQGAGANSAKCNSMNFFSSSQAASEWLGPNTDAFILTPAQAWKVADNAWVKPYTEAIAKLN